MKNISFQKPIAILAILILPLLSMAISAVQPSGDGSLGSPYQIANIDNLYWVSQNSASWGSYFEQTADIDASGTTALDTSDGWTPIGNSTTSFTGNYDGQDHTISDLFIDREESYQALFGYCTGATIENLNISDADISGTSSVSTLCGYATSSSLLSHCSASGSVNGSGYYAAGLVARLSGSTIEYSNSSVTVINSSYRTGGITGQTQDGSVITHCYATGDVSGTDRVGGLIGFVDNQTTISYCFATGEITDTGNYGGGLIGRLESTGAGAKSTVSNCYATGRVNGNNYTGGLVASVYSYSVVEDCYSTGYVTGNTSTGRLVGHMFNATISNCFFDSQTSGSSSTTYGTATTTANMKTESTFTDADWDFTSVWDMDGTTNDGYGFLTENSPEVPAPISLVSFDAIVKDGAVLLSWETASETDNASFLIYRNDEMIASIDGAGTSSEPHNYSVTDNEVVPGVTYTYILADLSYANELVKHEEMATTITLANDIVEADYVISAAYPNPFNPTAILPLELSSNATVKASLYDLNGREVKSLVNGNFTAGTHKLHIDGSNMTTGIYMVKILVNEIMNVQKIALVK